MTYALLLYGLAIGQVLLLYGLIAPQAIRVTERVFLRKNAAWVAETGAGLKAERLRRWFYSASAATALVLLAGIFAAASTNLSYSFPVTALIVPLMLAAPLVGGYAWVAYRSIYLRIPAAEHRKVSLTRRRLRDFVPSWTLGMGAIFAVTFALNYVSAFLRSLLPVGVLIGRAVLFLGLAIVLGVATVNAVKRREGFVAPLGGDLMRRFEVGFYLAVGYALVFAYQYLLTSDIANMPFPPSFALMTIMFGAMQIYALYFALWAGAKSLDADAKPGALIVKSVIVYGLGMALSLGLARVALNPVFERQAAAMAMAPHGAINIPDVRSWTFGSTPGKALLRYTLHSDPSLPGHDYWHVVVPYKGHEMWDLRARMDHVKPIKNGDVVEASVWLRSSTPGGADITGLTQSTHWGWTTIGKATWHVTSVWQLYRVTGPAAEDYGASGSDFELHLASGSYAVDIGPATVRNLGPNGQAR